MFKRHLQWISHFKFTGCTGNTCALPVRHYKYVSRNKLHQFLKIITNIQYNLISLYKFSSYNGYVLLLGFLKSCHQPDILQMHHEPVSKSL
jgi:hypothetical protein